MSHEQRTGVWSIIAALHVFLHAVAGRHAMSKSETVHIPSTTHLQSLLALGLRDALAHTAAAQVHDILHRLLQIW